MIVLPKMLVNTRFKQALNLAISSFQIFDLNHKFSHIGLFNAGEVTVQLLALNRNVWEVCGFFVRLKSFSMKYN